MKKTACLLISFIIFNFPTFTEALVLPLDVDLRYTHGDETTTLSKIIAEHDADALLLQFWSTTCPHCINALPVLKKRAEQLPKKKIIVVGINIDNRHKAESIRVRRKINTPWVMAPSSRAYRKRLMDEFRVPRAVLIDAEGEVRYNGHPNRPELSDLLDKFS